MMIEQLGLGTVQFGIPYGISNKKGQTPLEEVTRILDTARRFKIDLLDTASGYGGAEAVLGQHDLSEFKIVSKFLPQGNAGELEKQLSESLEKMGINHLYAYLAHRPLDLLEHPEQWDRLQKIKQSKSVTKIGFSLNDPSELKRLLAEEMIPDLIQVPFNYFDRRFEDQMKVLHQKGCEIHTRSTFLQGLFFIDPDKLGSFFDEIKPDLSEVQQQEELAGSLLNFVLSRSFVDKVIVGVENEEQLKENISSIRTSTFLPEFKKTISNHILKPSEWPKP